MLGEGLSTGLPHDPRIFALLGRRVSSFAMGISPDADEETLKAFLIGQDPEIPVFRADETKIQKFFRWVTVTVSSALEVSIPIAFLLLTSIILMNFGLLMLTRSGPV
jgi:hypothetical protein